jgi:hypothetical protein
MMPVVSPKLIRRGGTPLAVPPTSPATCCCISTIRRGTHPGSNGACGLRPTACRAEAAGSLRFKLYDQVIQAAVGGQGVALGRFR